MKCYSNMLSRNGYGKLYRHEDRIEWISYTCGKFVIYMSNVEDKFTDDKGNISFLLRDYYKDVIVFCPIK